MGGDNENVGQVCFSRVISFEAERWFIEQRRGWHGVMLLTAMISDLLLAEAEEGCQDLAPW